MVVEDFIIMRDLYDCPPSNLSKGKLLLDGAMYLDDLPYPFRQEARLSVSQYVTSSFAGLTHKLGPKVVVIGQRNLADSADCSSQFNGKESKDPENESAVKSRTTDEYRRIYRDVSDYTDLHSYPLRM